MFLTVNVVEVRIFGLNTSYKNENGNRVPRYNIFRLFRPVFFFFIIIFSNKYAYVFWKKDVFSIDFELIEKKFSVVLSPD